MIACQILVGVFLVLKILFLTEAIQNESILSIFSPDRYGQAIAQTTTQTAAKPVRDVMDDGLQKDRDLLALLQKKQQELDAREISVKAEEQKLSALKKEVTDKIDTLKALETQLSPKLDTEKTAEGKRLKDLAKVYEAAPPQKAAAMLEKLEVRTAAGITINMKRDRAGLVWGYLSPQKAVQITHEITGTPRPTAD